MKRRGRERRWRGIRWGWRECNGGIREVGVCDRCGMKRYVWESRNEKKGELDGCNKKKTDTYVGGLNEQGNRSRQKNFLVKHVL